MSSTEEHIRAQLLNTKSLPVSTAWISNFLASISQNQQRAPPSALAQTALFRILTTDFTKTLSTSMPSTVLPREISDPSIKERRISGPVPVQVLDIEDIGSSMWSQVEKIEQVERGETIRGREIVRNVNVDDADNNNASRSTPNTTNGPHRLILQDAAGTKIVALEYQDINGISIEKLSIGAKLVLKDTVVSRGMALLTPETVTLLGGKIESWDTTWRQKRRRSY
uniref:RecQ-mediated genome instability protein 1 n=1 Tax=Talaromyces marneffei PM1 TaxID=1077442 RepID=A0A093VD33_TALMA